MAKETRKQLEKEDVFKLLGRMSGFVKNTSSGEYQERGLMILDIISNKVSEMDLALPVEKRETI